MKAAGNWMTAEYQRTEIYSLAQCSGSRAANLFVDDSVAIMFQGEGSTGSNRNGRRAPVRAGVVDHLG